MQNEITVQIVGFTRIDSKECGNLNYSKIKGIVLYIYEATYTGKLYPSPKLVTIYWKH